MRNEFSPIDLQEIYALIMITHRMDVHERLYLRELTRLSARRTRQKRCYILQFYLYHYKNVHREHRGERSDEEMRERETNTQSKAHAELRRRDWKHAASAGNGRRSRDGCE